MWGWKHFLERHLGSLDELLPYITPRTVRIKDARLGISLLILQLAVLGYVVGYQLIYLQQYQVAGNVVAFSRMQLQRPTTAYRWTDGAAPYCLNGTGAGSSRYQVFGDGTYSYTGPSGLRTAQEGCLMTDELAASPNPLERDAIFLTTRVSTEVQAAVPTDLCANLSREFCEWVNISSRTDFVSDASLFTLLVDHSMYAPDAGITRSVRQMKGSMKVRTGASNPLGDSTEATLNARTVNPCDAYVGVPAGCPPFVNVGSVGAADVFPIATLLQAAGIAELDQVSGFSNSETYRYAGIVLILEVQYSNYFAQTGSWNPETVAYTYYVSAVPQSEFKCENAIVASTDGGRTTALGTPLRTVFNRHGVRVVLSFSGRIGSFNLQAFLINLFVSLGLLGVCTFCMELMLYYTCPLRHVYVQYKERTTVDFSLLYRRANAEALAVIMRKFETDKNLIDSEPAVFAAALASATAKLAEQTSNPVAGGGTPIVTEWRGPKRM